MATAQNYKQERIITITINNVMDLDNFTLPEEKTFLSLIKEFVNVKFYCKLQYFYFINQVSI